MYKVTFDYVNKGKVVTGEINNFGEGYSFKDAEEISWEFQKRGYNNVCIELI